MRKNDRGSLSVELVAVFAAVLPMVMLVVQGASWWYDRQVALGAAREGAAVAASSIDHVGTGPRQQAEGFLRKGGLLAGRVQADDPVTNGDTVTMTVHVWVNSVLSVWTSHEITVSVTVPVERFVGAGG